MKKDEINEVKEMVVSEKIQTEDNMQKKEKDFLEVLKLFAPGTALRLALDDLLRAKMGALIVIKNNLTSKITEKGFEINSKFSPQKLVELAKMDGAIILSEDMKRIRYANALLSPDVNIQTKETGARHKAAERTAKQTGTIVIAVSERKNKITIYYGKMKYELKESSEILRRAAETLQILEKQKEIYSGLIANLNLLEIESLVTINDLCTILQRIEIIKRIAGIVKRYLIELGKEGMVVSMRLKELIGNLNQEEEIILKDYFSSKSLTAKEILEKMDFDSLLETAEISKLLFTKLHDKVILPKGERLLSKINIPKKNLLGLMNKFENLDRILSAEDNEILEILEPPLLNSFKNKLSNLKEKIIMGKSV